MYERCLTHIFNFSIIIGKCDYKSQNSRIMFHFARQMITCHYNPCDVNPRKLLIISLKITTTSNWRRCLLRLLSVYYTKPQVLQQCCHHVLIMTMSYKCAFLCLRWPIERLVQVGRIPGFTRCSSP